MHNLIVNYRTLAPFAFEEAHTEAHQQIKGDASLPSVQQFESIKHHLDLFMPILLDTSINPENYELSIIQ